MTRYAIIDETGVVIGTGDAPDPISAIASGEGFGQIILLDESAPRAGQCWFDGEAFHDLPPKPGPWAKFDPITAQWTDPRTPADLEAELQAKRGAAWLTKPDFLLACMGAGILTPAEAVAAAQGIVPEPFQSAVDALDPMTQAYLAVIWPTATRIERMDPFIETIAAVRGFPDALVDQLFGIETS